MVMEHLDGTDFHRILRQSGPLPIGDALLYVWQACDAIAEAHAAGIIHRDIKPANLFLTHRRNGSPCVKVLDFGISKQAVDGGVELTRTGEIWGTPIYMAPERMARSQFADARSDIWSIGLVLYELLTRVRPFHAPSVTEVVARVLQEGGPSAQHPHPRSPPPVDAIVQRCLQKRPDDRFQTVDDLARALRANTVNHSRLPLCGPCGSSPALAPVANPRPAPSQSAPRAAPVACACPGSRHRSHLSPGAPAPPAAASRAVLHAASVPLALHPRPPRSLPQSRRARTPGAAPHRSPPRALTSIRARPAPGSTRGDTVAGPTTHADCLLPPPRSPVHNASHGSRGPRGVASRRTRRAPHLAFGGAR
ncbi:MAG: protein kinase [Polyangiaceae bacterium]